MDDGDAREPGQPRSSRFPGFYRLSVEERRRILTTTIGLSEKEIDQALAEGGLDALAADSAVENVIGQFGLPFAVGLNLRINGGDYLAPMVIEEPSVVAATGNAARWIRDSGGFHAETDAAIMIGQIQLLDVVEIERTARQIEELKDELLATARQASPGLVERGGGPRDIQVRALASDMAALHILIDCVDAMGANAVNTAVEAIVPLLEARLDIRIGIAIVSNLSDQRLVRVRCSLDPNVFTKDGRSGSEIAHHIAEASRFAELCPYRATTHNKGIMNGVDAVVLATGNDWRAVEAGAHAYAGRGAGYQPLCTWHLHNDRLEGRLEMPLAVGTVGGIGRVHRGVALAKQIGELRSARELAMLAASVGMATNLAALYALVTSGIQRGHMALHARSLAVAAGATGAHVNEIAHQMETDRRISLEAAREWLAIFQNSSLAERK